MTKENSAKKNKKGNNLKKTLEKTANIKREEKENKKKTIEKARRELHFENSSDSDEIIKLIKIVLLVTVIMLVFYFITTIVTRKANAIKTVRNTVTNEKAEIQYDNLIIGSMLNIDGTYYVLIEKNEDEKLTEYQTLLQMIEANDEAPKIYTASLDNSFNSSYLSDEINYDSDLSVFKVKGTALVKVSEHRIVEVFDNYEDIKAELDDLQ